MDVRSGQRGGSGLRTPHLSIFTPHHWAGGSGLPWLFHMGHLRPKGWGDPVQGPSGLGRAPKVGKGLGIWSLSDRWSGWGATERGPVWWPGGPWGWP